MPCAWRSSGMWQLIPSCVMCRGLAFVMSMPLSADMTVVGLPKPGQHLDQFRLPVALHASNADDLARAHLEGYVVERGSTQIIARG